MKPNKTLRPFLAAILAGMALAITLPTHAADAEKILYATDVTVWKNRPSSPANGTGSGGLLNAIDPLKTAAPGAQALVKPDPADPSTWTTPFNWPADFQGANAAVTIGATTKELTGNAWIIFDLGSAKDAFATLYLWNVSEGTGWSRGIKDFKLHYSTTPTVSIPGTAGGNAIPSTATEYDFASGGWTQLGGTHTLDRGGNNGGVFDLALDISAISSARYFGIEILTNQGDANGRAGLNTAVFTQVVSGMEWTGGTGDWSDAAKWDPALITDGNVTIDVAGSEVTVDDNAAAGFRLSLGETSASSLTIGTGNALTLTDDVGVGLLVGGSGSLTINGTLASPIVTSQGTTVIDPAADISGVGLVRLGAGTLSSSGNISFDNLFYTGGTINVAGTLSVPTSVTVLDSSLALTNNVPTQTFTLTNGSVTGGVVSASSKYTFTNVADYSADLTGASSTLVIGELRQTNDRVKLSGTDNTYGGTTTINRGYLEVSANAANLGGGLLSFDSSANSNQPAVLQTSGTFDRTIGNGVGLVRWNNDGGFAATNAPLTVSLAPQGGNPGDLLTWNNANTGFNGKRLHLGSPTSTASVEITNNITYNGNYTIVLFDNSATSADVSILSGNIVRDGTNNRNLDVTGSGTLVLSGSNNIGVGQFNIGSNTVVRAIDGTGLPTDARVRFTGGVLESSGTFTRNIADSGTNIYWNNAGGFAAHGGTLSVNLNGGATIDWNATNGFRGQTLILGSPTANNAVTIANDVDLKNNRTITVNDNPDSTADYAVLSGVLANGDASARNLTKNGAGILVLSGDNTYTGSTSVSAGTLFINGNQSSASGNVSVSANATLGGTGTIGGNTTIAANGRLEFDISTNAASHDKLDLAATRTLTFSGASVLTITSPGGASPGTYTLVTAPGGISGVAPATLNLPVDWVATVDIVGNDLVLDVTETGSGPGPVDSFEISAIGSPQTVGTPITGITITAKDASNATATSFTGTVTFGGTGGFSGTSATFTAGVLNGVSITPTVAGSNLTFTVVDDDGPSTGSTTIATIQTQYDAWAASFTPNPGGAGANPDGDAFTNLQEFAFGFDPNVSDGAGPLTISGGTITQNGPPQIYVDPVTGQFFLRYTRRTDYEDAGLVYTAEFAADSLGAGDFQDVPGGTVVGTGTGAGGVDIEAVAIEFPDALPIGGKKARFGRVGVTQAP